MNKSNEVVRYFEDLLRSPRAINDTSRLGYISTSKKGESSNNGAKEEYKSKTYLLSLWKNRSYKKCL